MRIVWCSWKDISHPQAGGAEVVTENILKRLADDGHNVVLLTADYPGAKKRSDFQVIRRGGRFSVYLYAWLYYRKHLRGKADVVVDEMNTIPFCASWYARTKSILMVHQLAREIWFYQLSWFIGWIGYVLEPVYLFLLARQPVVTVSESTKKDVMKYGFDEKRIRIISEGVEIERVKSLSTIEKYRQPTMLSLGAMRAMKRTLDQVKAFEVAKVTVPDLQLKIAGDGNDPYAKKVLAYIEASPYRDDIEYLGRVSPEQKKELMQKAHIITVTSVKEGWGLIVSEAASQGTPAAVYDVDGLRDSVQHNRTGLVATENTPDGLAEAVIVLLSDPDLYEQCRQSGWEAVESLTFDRSYSDFNQAVKELL